MKVQGLATGPAPGRAKEWAWSYSKLKNFEQCPKRMYEVDINKTYVEKVEPGGPLDWGNRVHAALAAAINGTPLPEGMEQYQNWVDRVRLGSGKLYVEQKYAITRDFQKTEYFASNVWYRGIADVVRVAGDLALVLDWKTGKTLDDPVQLMLMAQTLFSHFPELKYVRSEYVWLKDGCTSPEVFTRQEVADQWVKLLPRVLSMEAAAKDLNYPPKPGHLCRNYCPVVTCPFHGKGSSR